MKRHEKSGLKRSVGFIGVLGQSVASMAPTTTPTINVALVFAVAGAGSWLAYIVATCAVMLVALNLVPLARAASGAGSLSEWVAQGLGPAGRLTTAWALLLAYLAFAAGTLVGSADYASTLAASAGHDWPLIAWVGAIGAVAGLCAMRDVRLSTVLMLGLEGLSITLVLTLGVTILTREGITVDLAQIDAGAIPPGGLGTALLIGVLSFVGFEAAGSLGDEARDPHRSIPRALVLTPLLAGVFFVFAAFVMVLGFTHFNIDVAGSRAPLDDLAHALGRPLLGTFVTLGTAISLFACVIASTVAASRLAFALAQQGALPAALCRVNARANPERAVGVCLVIALVTALALSSFAKPVDIYDWLGTYGTFGCIVAYALTCLAAPIHLRSRGLLRPRDVALSVGALGVLGYVLFGSLYPVPEAPLSVLPWLFALMLAGACLWSTRAQRRHPAGDAVPDTVGAGSAAD